MFRAKRNQPSTIGIDSHRISDYAKSGATHPEGKKGLKKIKTIRRNLLAVLVLQVRE